MRRTSMIKLVITDIDGTLVTSGKPISKENMEAIQKLHENNIEFGVATGREYTHAKDTLKGIGQKIDFLCCSGAQYYDKAENLIMENLLHSKQIREVIEVINNNEIAHMIVTDRGIYSLDPNQAKDEFMNRVKERFSNDEDDKVKLKDLPFLNIKEIENLDSWLSSSLKVIKFEIFSMNLKQLQNVKDEVRFIEDIIALSSFEDNVEITHIKAQKGVILEQVAKIKGLKNEEVAIIGDSYNDISMFDLFDYSFAPSSGIEAIKNKAFHVTRSCEEHGFSEAVEFIIDKINRS